MPKPFNALKKEENDSESESSSSSEGSEEEPVKKPPPPPVAAAKAGEEDEEEEEQREEESDTESDSSSMTKAKATTTTTTMKSPSSSTKRGRDDKSEGEKLKAQENGGSKVSKKAKKVAEEEDEEKMKAEAAEKKKGRKQKKEDGDKSASEATEKQEKQQSQPEEPKKKHNGLWNPKDESVLAKKLLEDLKAGLDFHNKPRTDSYWTDLSESIKGKVSNDYTRDQVFDKHKRMKAKFDKLEKNDKDANKSARKRSSAEDALHAVFKQLWGKEEEAPAPAPHGDAGEESQGDMDTSEPAMKKEMIAAENGEQLSRLTMEALSRVGMLGSDPLMAICSSLCSGIQSLVRLGIGVDSQASREVRKRILEEQISEYSNMSRRLKLMMDYCQLEEELLKKKLSTLESSKH